MGPLGNRDKAGAPAGRCHPLGQVLRDELDEDSLPITPSVVRTPHDLTGLGEELRPGSHIDANYASQ